MQFQTAYGGFNAGGDEFIVTRPDTPMPWVNVLTNGEYGLTVSQAGSGYSWLVHASHNRITRWEQDLVRDDWGKYFYLRDADSGKFWSPTPQPCGLRLENYRARHGKGYSTFEGSQEGVESHLTVTVPLDAPCELWILRLRNTGSRPRRLEIYSYLEWNLGAAPDWHREFHRIFIDVAYRPVQQALLATKVLWDIPSPPPHWNRTWPYVAFLSASLPVTGFDGDKKSFIGRNGSLQQPAALTNGQMAENEGRWVDAIGSLRTNLELAPGEERVVSFILGAAADEAAAMAVVERFKAPEAAGEALTAAKKFWQEITGNYHVETPDPAFDLLANHWLPYQAIAGRIWGRSAYYQTGGAYGYRDQLQDSLLWLMLGQPEKTLDQIRLHAAHQYAEGIVLHWWHPLSDVGLKSGYSDDLLWLPYVTWYYLTETGDFACLDEVIPFYDEGEASLLEHCLRSFRTALSRRSPRGLPLILDADWNDGMNAVGDEGRGESIWMAHFLYYLLTRWTALPVLDEATRATFQREAEALRTAVNEHGWDGAWFWRATTDEGDLIGSRHSEEGQIFLNAQTWAVLSGITSPERGEQAMQSAREQLYQPYGALLLAPAYTRPNGNIGYLTRYAPGLRENGGVYFHAACWGVIAERKMRGAQAAYKLWCSLSPVLRGLQPDEYQAEPYVTPGNVDGPLSPYPGRAGWTWYTGSSQWFLRAMIEGVLGIEAVPEGLRVDADLPAEWNEFTLHRPYRGGVYQITIRRASAGEDTGCLVAGKPWQGDVLPPIASGLQSEVTIVI